MFFYSPLVSPFRALTLMSYVFTVLVKKIRYAVRDGNSVGGLLGVRRRRVRSGTRGGEDVAHEEDGVKETGDGW